LKKEKGEKEMSEIIEKQTTTAPTAERVAPSGERTERSFDGGNGNAEGGERKRGMKPKRRPCGFCMAKIAYLDYKDVGRLRKYLTEKGKIISRRQTGLCARHQREITQAIKRARQMSLI